MNDIKDVQTEKVKELNELLKSAHLALYELAMFQAKNSWVERVLDSNQSLALNRAANCAYDVKSLLAMYLDYNSNNL